MRKMRKTAKQGKLSLGTGQRVGLQGPRALTSGARNSMHMSHENRNPWESSHPTHPKDAASGSQNSARRALNAATMHVSAAAKTRQPTAATTRSHETANPLKSRVCQWQTTAATL